MSLFKRYNKAESYALYSWNQIMNAKNYIHIHKTFDELLTGICQDRIDIIKVQRKYFFFKKYKIVFRKRFEDLDFDVSDIKTNKESMYALIDLVHRQYRDRTEYFKNAGLELLDYRGSYIRTVNGLILDFSDLFNCCVFNDDSTMTPYCRIEFNKWLNEKNLSFMSIVGLCADLCKLHSFNVTLKESSNFLK